MPSLQQLAIKTNTENDISNQKIVLSPSTPQKLNVFQSQQLFNPQGSECKKYSESPQVRVSQPSLVRGSALQQVMNNNNKENAPKTIDIKCALNENKKLNELIQRLFREKQEMMGVIDKLTTKQSKDCDFGSLQDRVERLEQIIDQQSEEIEEWKQKYTEACEQDSEQNRKNLIAEMEKQIIIVVEENERLNNLTQEKEEQISGLRGRIENDEETLQQYQEEITKQKGEKIEMEQELMNLKEQFEALDQQIQHDLAQKEQEIHKVKIITNVIKQFKLKGLTSISDKQSLFSQLLENVQILEGQVEDLGNMYAKQTDEKNLQAQEIIQLKEQLELTQKQVDSYRLKYNKGGNVNERFSAAQHQVKQLKENLMKSFKKQ